MTACIAWVSWVTFLASGGLLLLALLVQRDAMRTYRTAQRLIFEHLRANYRPGGWPPPREILRDIKYIVDKGGTDDDAG